MTRVIVTGGCGFIGHHMVEHIKRNTNWEVVVIDYLSYASGGVARLDDSGAEYKLFTHNLLLPVSIGIKKEIGEVDYIIHMAAETHVDNSIRDPVMVIQNNIMSTVHMLEYARELKVKRFVYFSTDEVYGPALGSTLFKENDAHRPTNPYSASKSAGESICVSYANTYGIPFNIVNVMNAFGERQHTEKFIPKCINDILAGNTVQIHSYPDKIRSGTRFYIHCRNISDAVLFIINNGGVNERYNIEGEREVSNLEIAQIIAEVIGKELKYEMVDFHSDRPGHDLRYGLDGTKLRELGWSQVHNFDTSLRNTIRWTLNNPKWLTF